MSENRIMLGVSASTHIPFSFVTQLQRLHEFNGALLPMIALEAGAAYLHRNRTVIARDALLYSDWDYLLVVDTDMILPDHLIETVKQYTDPVIGCMYFGRQPPDFGPQCRMVKDLEAAQFRAPTEEEVEFWLSSPGLHDVDGVGTGCLAIRRDVLEHWPKKYPTFNTILPPDGNNMLTEDIYFSWRCLMQGIQPKLDSRVICGHMSSIVVDERFYMATRLQEAPA